MGSSTSSNNRATEPNLEAHEQFNFRFTDCSCKCNANKRRIEDITREQNNSPQVAFLTALITQSQQPQYDIDCDCECGKGIKLGFLFGNASLPARSPNTNNSSDQS